MANTATITFPFPTQNTDGSALALSAITSFDVYAGTNKAVLSKLQTVAGPFSTPTESVTVDATALGFGTIYFAVDVSDAAGTSAFSPIGSKTFAAPVPMAPSNLTVA
jgi:hypothetical protein